MRVFLSFAALLVGTHAYSPYARSQLAKQTVEKVSKKYIDLCDLNTRFDPYLN